VGEGPKAFQRCLNCGRWLFPDVVAAGIAAPATTAGPAARAAAGPVVVVTPDVDEERLLSRLALKLQDIRDT